MSVLGTASIIFAVVMILIAIAWFHFYASDRVDRYGAIFHVFARLGEQRFDALDTELRGIIKEKGF